MKVKKGDVFTIQLDKNSYGYLIYIAGNSQIGDLIKICKKTTIYIITNEEDINKLLECEPLYEGLEYLIAFALDFSKLQKIGNIKLNYKNFLDKDFYLKTSIKASHKDNDYASKACSANLEREEEKKYYKKLKEDDFLKGVKYFFDDWKLYKYKIATIRGKFISTETIEIGKLSEEFKNTQFFDIAININDLKEKLLNKNDRLSVEIGLWN